MTAATDFGVDHQAKPHGVRPGRDTTTRRLVAATEAGLALCVQPYAELATRLGLSEKEVLACLSRLLEEGGIRRIAAVPNHYALGYVANGMSVWDVPDEHASECGRLIGALPFVSHCYLRPRRPPRWPFNLFAMVHAKDRAGVETQVQSIRDLLGERQRSHAVLYSKRILKKTGMRLGGGS